MERTAAKHFLVLNFKPCRNKNFLVIGEQTAAAWNDVTANKLLAGCFKTFSWLPEDWTASGPCPEVYRSRSVGVDS